MFRFLSKKVAKAEQKPQVKDNNELSDRDLEMLYAGGGKSSVNVAVGSRATIRRRRRW